MSRYISTPSLRFRTRLRLRVGDGQKKKPLLCFLFTVAKEQLRSQELIDLFPLKILEVGGIGDKASVLLIWASGDPMVFELPFKSSDQNAPCYNREHRRRG